MASGIDLQLVFAAAIVAVALVLFGAHLISTTKRAGYLLSESSVPRRYLVVGLAAGLGILYVFRH